MADNIVVDVDADTVTIIAVPGQQEAFASAARALGEAGTVRTVTGPRGVALATDLATATKAGLVKKPTSRRKAKSNG